MIWRTARTLEGVRVGETEMLGGQSLKINIKEITGFKVLKLSKSAFAFQNACALKGVRS